MTVFPGDRLACTSSSNHKPGAYTYAKDGGIFSTIIGELCVVDGVVSVSPRSERVFRSAVPQIGQIVYGRVTKVTPRFAGVDIIASSSMAQTNVMQKLPIPIKATIRQQDIYSVEEREEAQVYDCFRPTDLIRASIIGIGDTSTGLLLSTGLSPELGVMMAKSCNGHDLQPIAWNEMMCTKTGAKEKRKVAKPAV